MKPEPKTPPVLLGAFLSLSLAATAVGESVLWQLDVVGPATPPNVAVTTAPNIDAAASTDGAGYAASDVGLSAFDTSGENTIRHAAGGVLEVTDFNDRHTQFTIAAAPGFVLNPTSLTFDSNRGGPAGTRGFEIYAGVEGTPTIDDLVLKIVDEPGTRAAPTPRTVDLSGVEFQGITSITFRYFPLTTAAGSTIEFDAMALNGEVVPLDDPFAHSGGPYVVQLGRFLSLDASASLPSFGETITAIEWDLNNNDDFSDASGATPAPISSPDLQSVWGMGLGENTIQLRVTDSAAKSATVSTTVTLVPVTAPIANASFEEPELGVGQIAAGAPGWSAFDDGTINVLHPFESDFSDPIPEGNNVGLVTSNSGVEDGFSQVLSGATGTLQPDASYTLEVEVGNSAFTTGFPGYRVQLLAAGTVLAEDDNSLSVGEAEFVSSTVNYTFDAGEHAALVGEPLEIRLLSKGLDDSGLELAFDDVRLSLSLASPVAEPGGPYTVRIGDSLSLDASGSMPSDGAVLTSYEWDLNNDGNFGDVSGEIPASISTDDLEALWNMVPGPNIIQLRVTDSADNTSTATTTVNLVFAEVTPGFGFLADASQDGDGNNRWEDLTGISGVELLLDDDPAVVRVPVTLSSTQFTHAYEFPGGQLDNNGGALLVQTGETTNVSFSAAAGNWLTSDVTMEIWFKPNNLTPTPDNGQILFEDGGGNGLGLFISNNQLQLRRAGGDGLVSYDLVADPDNLLAAAATNEFIQAVATYQTSNGDIELFINGVSVGTSSGSGGTWSGGDPAAFGTRGGFNTGGIGGGQSATESFDGQMALIRIYSGMILTEEEVADNFTVLSGPDIIPPVVETLHPSNNSSGVYPGIDLVATFTKNIALTGEGSITIKNLDASTEEVINLPHASVSVSDRTLTIVSPSGLGFDTQYAIRISPDAIEDLAAPPNPFAGITDDSLWTFDTAAELFTAPVIVSLDPENEEIDVLPTSPLVATFDHDIVVGNGNIVIRNLTDDEETTISVGDTTQVSISGPVLTINPLSALPGGKDLAIRIDPGAVRNFSDIDFAGIEDDTTWSFSTVGVTVMTESSNWQDGVWSAGQPTIGIDAVIAQGITASASGSVDPWEGTLTMEEDSVLNMTKPGRTATSPPDIPIDGATTVIMEDGSRILDGFSNLTLPMDFVISGEAGMAPAGGVFGWNRERTFTGVISGDGTWTTNGRNRMGYTYNNTNTYTGGYIVRSSDRHGIGLNAPGSAGAGDVTVLPREEDGRSGVLILGADNVFAPTAVLTLNGLGWDNSTGGFGPYGSGPHVGSQVRISMNEFNATVAELWIDDVRMPDGQYTGTDGDWIAGTGILTVGDPPVGTPFDTWSAGFPGLTDTDPTLDFDGGGLATALEWVFGGDPTDPSDDAGLVPTIDATSDPDGKLLFTFRRNIDAENDADTTIIVEYGNDLAGWTAATHQGEGAEDITLSVVPDGFGPGIDAVTVALPQGLAADGKLFVRLNVEVDTAPAE